MAKIGIILALVFYSASSSASSSASEQDLYYNIHQAYTALEEMLRGKCKDARTISKPYLINADKELGKIILVNNESKSQFEPSLHKLWSVWKSKKIKMLDVESVRAEVQPIADEKKLIHYKKKWHDEINNKCDVVLAKLDVVFEKKAFLISSLSSNLKNKKVKSKDLLESNNKDCTDKDLFQKFSNLTNFAEANEFSSRCWNKFIKQFGNISNILKRYKKTAMAVNQTQAGILIEKARKENNIDTITSILKALKESFNNKSFIKVGYWWNNEIKFYSSPN